MNVLGKERFCEYVKKVGIKMRKKLMWCIDFDCPKGEKLQSKIID